MRSLTRGSGLVLLVVLVLSTGPLSGAAPGFDARAVPEPPADPGTLVLQLREWQSLTPPYERAELPEFTLYGGGRVVVGASWDGSVHQAWEYTLSPQRYRQVYRLAHAAGLARAAEYAEPFPHTDGSLLVAALWSAGRLRTSTLVSPSERDTGARGRIVEFRRNVRLLAVPTDPSRAAVYHPTRLAVLATGGWAAPTGDIPGAGRQWPGLDLRAAERTRIGLCTVLAGSAVPDALARGRDAELGAGWQSGEHWVTIAVRPLLPDEYDCADLDRRVP